MEEEFDIRELFHLMNSKDGEFFIRVLISEEGELYGEKAGSGFHSFGEGATTDEFSSYTYTV